MIYGPDKTPILDNRRNPMPKLIIPKFAEAHLEFSSKTDREFAIFIFDSEDKLLHQIYKTPDKKVFKRVRTKDRPLTIYAWDKRETLIENRYKIPTWFQLPGRLVMNNADNNSSGVFEFEDQINSKDQDYDDIRISYRFS